MSQQPSITLIAGPTASGKSALALKLARETGAVILNADSQQLYADLRILTARPSEEDEALADHRLYGVADAADAWSVGRWSRAALAEIERLGEGAPVILVGGTGLYFLSLTRGLAHIPNVPLEVRESVERDYETLGEAVFRARLAAADPASASAIERGDRQRLIRAMSVLVASGCPLSAWRAKTQPLLIPGTWKGLVIQPERSVLYDTCEQRVDRMMEEGAVSEVEALLARGLASSLPAMKAVGMRELADFLRGHISREAATAALKQATRNYAKRQLTWFRNQTRDWAITTIHNDPSTL